MQCHVGQKDGRVGERWVFCKMLQFLYFKIKRELYIFISRNEMITKF